MSIWRNIFESTPSGSLNEASQEVSYEAAEELDGPLGAFLQKVRLWSCPLFGTCDEHGQKSVRASALGKGVHSVAFTIAVVVLSAKLAKADGHVTRDEVATFKQLFTVPESEQRNVGRLFNQARKDSAGFESYAKQLGRMFEQNDPVFSDLIGCLFSIAAADGLINEDEGEYLREVASHFGINDDEFANIASRYSNTDIEDPFIILGASPMDPPEILRRKYRAIVAQIHPDKLASQGLPQERVEQATRQLARVNAAFEIAQQRSLNPNGQKVLEPA